MAFSFNRQPSLKIQIFCVIDRKGDGENLIIHKFEKEKIILEF